MANRMLSYTISANQPIIRRNLDAYSKAIDKMDARHEEAIKQKSALDIAFSQLDVNEAEDGWKSALRDKMQAEIDSAAMFGNYASAYDTAILSAGKLMSNPEVIGRIRANAQYNEYKKTVMNNNKIDQITKDRWIEENPYHYEDKYDNNGNVVGGSSWSPNWNPVDKVDLTDIYARVGQLAAAEAGGSENVQYLAEDGSIVSDPAKGFYGMAYKRGTKYERLSEEKLRSMFDAIFKQYPGAMESILQDRDNRIWEYNRTKDEDKKSFIGSDIIDEKGATKSAEDYLADRVNPVLKGMAYDRTYTSIDVGNAFAQKLQADRAAAKPTREAQSLYMLEEANTPSLGANIVFSSEEHAKQIYTTYQSTLNNLAKLFPRGFNNKELQQRLSNGDYVGAGKMLKGWIRDENLREAAQQAIARMIDSGNALKQFTVGKSKEDIDALGFVTAIENGSELPAGNIYTQRFNQELNKFLNGSNYIYLHLGNVSNIHEIAKRYGGEVLSTGDGIGIPRNKAAQALNELNRNITLIGRANRNTGKVDWSSPATSVDGGVPYTAGMAQTIQGVRGDMPKGVFGVLDAAKVKTTKIFGTNETTEALSIDPHGNPNRQIAWNLYLNGSIAGEAFSKYDKHSEEMLRSAVLGAEFWQYPVYADKNNKDLKLVGAKDTQRLTDSLDNASEKDIEIYACNTSHGYGTYVKVRPHKNTKGKDVPETVFFVQGLGDNKAANAIYKSPTGRASAYYNQLSGFGTGSYTTIDGETFENINSNGGYYNGQFVDRNTIVKTMAASNQEEDIMDQLDDLAESGNSITYEEAKAIAAKIATEYGLTAGSPDYTKFVNSRTSRILNKFD